jgi:ATP-binding cassette subfamily B (MDR/TAP) protein 1
LLERWYDLNEGFVKLDGLQIKDWELCHLRSQLALVGQEPVLFNTSIRDSIAYGSLESVCTDEMVEKFARMANIHDFISGLPQV